MLPATQLIPQLAAIAPALIVFDKDGTLIDFHAMWGHWVTELARRLEATTGLAIKEQLFRVMAFEVDSGAIAPAGPLAVTPLAGLHTLTGDVLREAGLAPAAIDAAMHAAWYLPDPVTLARPLADLPTLFNRLRACDLKIAIATSDDHAPTEALLNTWGLSSLVDMTVGADDGLPIKPAPDMLLSICQSLNNPPAKTVMVGDNVADLQMGRAAGVAQVIGVLSGVSSAVELRPHADFLLPTINELLVW